jgi:hypothetical protein
MPDDAWWLIPIIVRILFSTGLMQPGSDVGCWTPIHWDEREL